MSSFVKTIVRAALMPSEVGKDFIALATGATPKIYKGVGCEFQIALFNSTTELFDITNILDITLMVKPQGQPSGSTEILTTLEDISFNAALTIDQWEAGTAAHASFPLLGTETSIAAGLHDLTFWGHTLDAGLDPDVFGQTTLEVLDRGITAITNPVLTPSYPTLEQVSAMILALGTNLTLNPGGTITIPDTNGKTTILSCENGQLKIANTIVD